MDKHYQIVSTDTTPQDLSNFLMQLHEQYDTGFKKFFSQPTNNLFKLCVYKSENNKTNFIFSADESNDALVTHARFQFKQKNVFETTEYINELQTFKHSMLVYAQNDYANIFDPGSENNLYDIMEQFPKNVLISIKFKRHAYDPQLKKRIEVKERTLLETKKRGQDEKDIYKDISTRIQNLDYMFDVQLELVVKEKNDENKIKLLALYKLFKTHANIRFNKLKIGNFWIKYKSDEFVSKMKLTLPELNKIVYVPAIDDENKELLHTMDANYYSPDETDFQKGVLLGYIKHPFIKDRAVYVSDETFEKHLSVAGQTGSGKSAMLLGAIDDVIKHQKYGFMFVDPKKKTAIKILNHLLYMEKYEGVKVDWSKVHYIDLNVGDYVPAMNLLDDGNRDINDTIEKQLELFQEVYASGPTPKLDTNFRNILGTLLLAEEHPTILDASKLISDTKYQKKLQSKITGHLNKEFKDFWSSSSIKQNNHFDSLNNRLSLFQPSVMKRLFGRPEMELDFIKWANEGHIVLVNSLGLSNRAVSLILGHMANTAFKQIVFKAQGTKSFFLVVDEGKQAQLSIFPRVTAEGRELGLHLIFTTQDLSLLNKEFTKELMGNITTYCIGRHGGTSAKMVSEIVSNDQMEIEDTLIKNLPDNTMILRTQLKKEGQDKFVSMCVNSKPPYWYLPNGQIAEHKNEIEEREASDWAEAKALELQKRDWKHKDVIDAQLADISEFFDAHVPPPSEDDIEDTIADTNIFLD